MGWEGGPRGSAIRGPGTTVRLDSLGEAKAVRFFSSGPPRPGGPSALFQEALWVLLGLNPTQG